MNTLDVLRAARAIIAEEERWTQNALARDANGEDCPLRAPAACCFCALGAVIYVLPDRPCIPGEVSSTTLENDVMRLLWKETDHRACAPTFHGAVASFNDSCTHAEVLALFDRAIASEQARAVEAG